MGPEDLLRRLPAGHTAVLCLRGAGADDLRIAAELDMAVEAVAPLLRVAEAKLDHALAELHAELAPIRSTS